MQLLAILSILLASFASSTCKLPSPTSDYANHIILVEPDIYILYWNYTNEDILFETHVKNNGWSAFGLSPNGGMDNSDVAVTWLNDNGTINFSDRHISGIFKSLKSNSIVFFKNFYLIKEDKSSWTKCRIGSP